MRLVQRLLTILISCLIIVACAGDPSSPEQQVRNSLQAMEAAAEKRSMTDFMRYISDDYSDDQGNDKKTLRQLVQYLFLRNQNINIFSLIRSIEINGESATVELSAAMASRDVDLSQESNRLKADTQRFAVILGPNKNNTVWLIKSANWKRGW